MRPPWWIDENGNVRLNVPIYTEETGWALISEEVPPVYYDNGDVEYRLQPYFPGAGHDSRMIVLSEDPKHKVEVWKPETKLSKARLAGSPALVNLMVDMVALQEPPLISGPFSHGVKETQFTRSAAGQLRTREGQYKAARVSGDPLAFARALRDLVQRAKLKELTRHVPSMNERALLQRMATEMAFEMAYALPRPRSVKPEKALDWGKAELVRRIRTNVFPATD
jgi:hypothetical protein